MESPAANHLVADDIMKLVLQHIISGMNSLGVPFHESSAIDGALATGATCSRPRPATVHNVPMACTIGDHGTLVASTRTGLLGQRSRWAVTRPSPGCAPGVSSTTCDGSHVCAKCSRL